MTNRAFKAGVSGLVVAFLMCFVGRAVAVETPQEQLVHAYHLLKHANHDYEGHRVLAMNHVSAAAKDLGILVGGDLPVIEGQWKSDQQLRTARELLRSCRAKLEFRDRRVLRRASNHVAAAIVELDAALKLSNGTGR